MIVTSNDAINKPNGVAFYQDQVVISQKNSKCISLYHRDTELKTWIPISHCFGPSESVSFGRLGNVVFDSVGYLYVCDERQNIIWKLDRDFKLVDSITGWDSGVGMDSFLPFSCCLLNKNLLCVCGGLNFQIISLQDKSVIYCSENMGELHGVAYNHKFNRLYVADRSHSVVRAFQLTFSGDN